MVYAAPKKFGDRPGDKCIWVGHGNGDQIVRPTSGIRRTTRVETSAASVGTGYADVGSDIAAVNVAIRGVFDFRENRVVPRFSARTRTAYALPGDGIPSCLPNCILQGGPWY